MDRKSVREIMEEFDILIGKFDNKNMINSENILDSKSVKKILDAVNFVDFSYQELWEQIVGDIRITNNDAIKIKQN